MKVNGKMTRNKVMVGNCWLMDLSTREIMLLENHMDRGNLFGLVEKHTKDNGTWVLRRVKVYKSINRRNMAWNKGRTIQRRMVQQYGFWLRRTHKQ